MELVQFLLGVALLALLAYLLYRAAGQIWSAPGGLFRRIVVFEWERALVYRDGRFERELTAGSYWLGPGQTHMSLPVRSRTVEIAAQEVLTADRMQIKLTAVLVYRITDLRKAVETSGKPTSAKLNAQPPPAEQALYREAQLALRAIAASRSLEAVLDGREGLSDDLRLRLGGVADEHGLALEAASVRDVILSAELRRLYAETERARLEGLAALERARGEQAALRSLANAARMLKNNPELMNLRLLQSVDTRSGKANTTIVLGEGSLAKLTRGDNNDGGMQSGPDITA